MVVVGGLDSNARGSAGCELLLEQAFQAHRAGHLDQALALYERLQQRTDTTPVAFMNAAAVRRVQGQPGEGVQQALAGLRRFPEEAGLWNNLGTCYRDLEQHSSAVGAFRMAVGLQPDFCDARLSLAASLRQIGLQQLAYGVLLDGLRLASDSEQRNRYYQPLVAVLLALPEERRGSTASLVALVEQLDQVDPDPASSPGSKPMMLGQLWLQLDQLDRALSCRQRVETELAAFLSANPGLHLKPSFQKAWHTFNWNLGITLLRQGELREGWRLYEHGLQVPAEGAQRWQRSLFKPFTPSQLPIWRGESLQGKRLLLLGEQGIGDTMMFATLIPRLQEEGAQVALLPGDRLLSLYRRSLPDVAVLSTADVRQGRHRPEAFDWQCPIGSIVQHRFHAMDQFAPRSPFLKADLRHTAELRSRYCAGHPDQKLVGISWQGGGKPKRIAAKSITLKRLAPLLSLAGVRFVSLQYGDDGPHLQRFRNASGIEVLHDDSINPLKDMDAWHAQVAAMDAVVSIANTTIHGAGGLGVPTLCLLSREADWRWVKPQVDSRCYWYPSVDIVHQAADGSWDEALSQGRQWLIDCLGCG